MDKKLFIGLLVFFCASAAYAGVYDSYNASFIDATTDIVEFLEANGESGYMTVYSDGDWVESIYYQYDYANGENYYYMAYFDYEQDGTAETIDIWNSLGYSSLEGKMSGGTVSSRLENIKAGVDSDVAQSEYFFYEKEEEEYSYYQNYSCAGISGCSLSGGNIDETTIDAIPGYVQNTDALESFNNTLSAITTYIAAQQGSCELRGDLPPCGEISLSEVINHITAWSQGQATLTEVINLISAWAG